MTNPKQLCIADSKTQPIPWDDLRELADKDNRKLSDYVRLVIINHVKEQKR